jgi:hypothetical protein
MVLWLEMEEMEEGSCGVSANEYSCTHHVTWSPINFGYLTPYLAYVEDP